MGSVKPEEIQQVVIHAAKQFYAYIVPNIEKPIEEYTPIRDFLIEDWMRHIFDSYFEGRKEDCYIWFNTPEKILKPYQDYCITAVVIDESESARELHKRITSFFTIYYQQFFHLAKQKEADGIYDLVKGIGINITEDFELIKPNDLGIIELEPNKTKTQKLNWIGKKNQLYAILRQLKESNLIGNTYDELVVFLLENITGFENANSGTIARELKRNNTLPHAKRIKLNIEPEE